MKIILYLSISFKTNFILIEFVIKKKQKKMKNEKCIKFSALIIILQFIINIV